MLDSRFDEDWIRVELVAGKSYDIRLQGVGLDAVADSVLKIFNSEGEEIAFNDDIETESSNLFSMVEFSPDATGAYYISASGEDIASYRYSDAGVDVLYGGPDGGDDLLAGGTGDDRLYGGKGNDTLEGGPGNGLNLYKEAVCALNSLGSEYKYSASTGSASQCLNFLR